MRELNMYDWKDRYKPTVGGSGWQYFIDATHFGVRWRSPCGGQLQKIVSLDFVYELLGILPAHEDPELCAMVAFAVIEDDDAKASMIGADSKESKH